MEELRQDDFFERRGNEEILRQKFDFLILENFIYFGQLMCDLEAFDSKVLQLMGSITGNEILLPVTSLFNRYS